MNLKTLTITLVVAFFATSNLHVANTYAAKTGDSSIVVYDESAYTAFVENKMKELDALYLQFCNTCNVKADEAYKARKAFYASVRDLLQYMNTRFDGIDPKKGAALSPTEVLINIHVLTMLVDMLTETQIEDMAEHPYN